MDNEWIPIDELEPSYFNYEDTVIELKKVMKSFKAKVVIYEDCFDDYSECWDCMEIHWEDGVYRDYNDFEWFRIVE